MKNKAILVLLISISFMLIGLQTVFSQEQANTESQVPKEAISSAAVAGSIEQQEPKVTEEQQAPEAETMDQAPAVSKAEGEPEVQWLWGEVVSVDIQNKELTVNYLDYETDQEREIKIVVDNNTTYENAKELLDIKPKDPISIDYMTNSEGKNIARNISIEKPEAEQAVEAPVVTQPQATEPEVVQPEVAEPQATEPVTTEKQ